MLNKTATSQRGFSLIEALIALLVLSIGLVGMGALMLTAMQNVHSSAHFSAASAVVLDFEELLWREVALTVASDPTSLDTDGCISDNAINALAETVTKQWRNASAAGGADRWSDAERFSMPSIRLTAGNTTVAGVDKDNDGVDDVNWKMIPVRLTWDEARFTEDQDQRGEVYTANITIVCRPRFL